MALHSMHLHYITDRKSQKEVGWYEDGSWQKKSVHKQSPCQTPEFTGKKTGL